MLELELTPEFEPRELSVPANIETVVWEGGGGVTDYGELTGKPSINGVELDGDKFASDYGLGTYSKPSGGIPASDLSPAVQTSLGKADTALQSVPSTYRTAAAQDVIDATKITAPSSPATGAFLVWNGTAWVAADLPAYNGGVS